LSKPRTVLFVSRYFPPAFDVGGRRAYHLARYLPEYGYRSVIVTAREPVPEKRDPAPLDLPPTARLVREFEPEGYQASKTRLSDGTLTTPVASPRAKSGPLELLGKQFALPMGPEAKLVPHLRRVLLRVIAEERPDVIFASSSPYAVLLAGHLAAKASGVPLCLDLRDPWSLNFLQRGKAAWIRAAEARLERFLFEQASLVTVTSEATAEAYRHLYPSLDAAHIATVYNAFDPARRPRGGPKEGPIRLVHFGNCYGPRSLKTVLEAMAVLRKKRPELEVELLNLGRVSERDLELASELGVAERFKHRPVVPYGEGIELLAKSDLPILLAYGEETLFIPAKFYDYLLSGSPMLCISNPSELTKLVSELGAGSSAGPDDVASAVKAIERVAEARERGEVLRIDEQRASRFSAPAAARRLAELFDRLLDGLKA
jgi:hypothetical protein